MPEPLTAVRRFQAAILLALFSALTSGMDVSAACSKSVEDVDGDGLKEIVVENELVKLVFKPEKGGECVGVSSKDGRLPAKMFKYGLFAVCDWRRNWGDGQVFSQTPFTFEFEKEGPEEVVLHQYRQGENDYRYISVHSRMSLKSGQSSFTCAFSVQNASEAMGKATIRLWLHNWMTPAEGDATCYLADEPGIRQMSFTAGKGTGGPLSLSAPKTPQGWMAVKKGGGDEPAPGVALSMDWRYLQWMYFWFSNTDITPEWRYVPIPLDAGKAFQTKVEVMPFPDLPQVTHAQEGIVYSSGIGQNVQEPGKRTMRLSFGSKRSVKISLSMRPVKIPDDPPYEFQELKSASLDGEAWKTAELEYAIPDSAPGTYVLKAVASENGRAVADFGQSFDLKRKAETLSYVYRPSMEKAPEASIVVKTYWPWSPSRTVETPHFDWYDPCAMGKPNVLWLGNYTSWSTVNTTSRAIIELAQRLDMEFTAPALTPGGHSAVTPPLNSTSGFADNKEYLSRLGEYVTDKSHYDTILIEIGTGQGGNKDQRAALWKEIPAGAKKRMADMVEAGCGLICMAEPTPEYGALYEIYEKLKGQAQTPENSMPVPPPDVLPEKEIKRLVAGKQLVYGQFGKGRVLFRLSDWTLVPADDNEAHYKALAELVLWASGKDSPLQAASLALLDPKPDMEKWEEQELLLSCKSTSDITGLTAETNWFAEKPVPDFLKYDEKGKLLWYLPEWEQLGTVKTDCHVKAGEQQLALPCGPARAGMNEARVRLLKDGKVLRSLQIDYTVAPSVAVKEVRLDKNVLVPEEKVLGKALLENNGKEVHKIRCVITAADIYGREFHRQESEHALEPSAKAEIPFSFGSGIPVGVLHRVRADLFEEDASIASAAAEYTVPSVTNRFDDYIAFSWGRSDKMTILQMMSLGFDSYYYAYCRNPSSWMMRRLSHRALDYGFRLLPCQVGSDLGFDWQSGDRLVRKVSFSDPAYLEKEKRELSALAAVAADYGAYAFNLADEPSLGAWETHNQFDWSVWSLDNFRKKWLPGVYGSIDKLNAEWETAYKSFDEVEPAVEKEVKDKANLAPWQDFRAHMNHEVANAYRVFHSALTSADKGVFVGPCGVNDGHPYSGFDWWEMAGICDNVNTYTNCAMLRSMTPRGKFSRYEGYNWPYLVLVDNAWKGFFEGHQGYSYWTSGLFIHPDYTIAEEHAKPVREILSTFKNGVGKLWMETERMDGGIKFHYSQPSIHTCWMMKYWQKAVNDGLQLYRQNRWGMEMACYDASLDLGYMAYGQIERGDLEKEKPALLVLPLSISLSAKEIECIRNFVEDGGAVLADVCCGLRDNHGRPYAQPPLDELFGIKRDAEHKNTLDLVEGFIPGKHGNVNAYVEKGIVPVAGKPYARLITKDSPDGLPLAIVNTVGRGRTIYLGFLGQYFSGRQQKPQLTALYRELLDNVVGLKGKYRVVGDQGRTPGRTLVHSWGDADYFGFYQDLGYAVDPAKELNDASQADVDAGTQDLAMLLPKQSHVYDVSAGKYLGYADCFKFRGVPGRGRLYASLPYHATGIRIETPGKLRPGEVFTLKADLQKEGTGKAMHAYHLRVFDPKGQELTHYRKNYKAENGLLTTKLQLPLNSVKGAHKISLREIATGLAAEAILELE